MVALVDYTIDEALRRGVPLADMGQMMNVLEGYGIDAYDVSFKHLYRQRGGLHRLELHGKLRCRIRPAHDELSLFRRMGIKQAALAVSCKESDSLSLYKLDAALQMMKGLAVETCLVIEDADQAFYTEFRPYWPLVERYGVTRIVYCDTGTRLDPFLTRSSLKELLQEATCPVEFCAFNTFGLATANTLGALKAGVEHVGASVCGIGLKGMAAMEEVLMAVRHLWKQAEAPSGHMLAVDCEAILAPMNIQVPVDKAVIGRQVFSHESGIHVDGVAKNPELYEVIRPEEVGLKRQLVIGKHSGTASLKHKFREWDVELDPGDAAHMLEQVRELAERQKRPLSDVQLMELYRRRNPLWERVP